MDLTFHGSGQWIDGGIPIPLRPYLYHDWTVINARMPRRSNVLAEYREALENAGDGEGELEFGSFLTLERQRIAKWAVEGQRLGVYFQGSGAPKDKDEIDGPPGVVSDAIRGNLEFLREMIRLRGEAKPFLIYGRMLREPKILTR